MTIFGYKLVEEGKFVKDYKKLANQIREEANEHYKKLFKKKIEELEDRIENIQETNKDLKRKLERVTAERDVLEDDRDKVREVVELEMRLTDLQAELDTRKELLDERLANVKTREAGADSKDGDNYKKGYADGVADGVRKIHEITQEDRNNAMKIAMVAASSHTPVGNMKEINSAHQITSGNTDK